VTRRGLAVRGRALWCAFWFSVRPWWMYEDECHHHPWGYWRHLAFNLVYATRWLRPRVAFGDLRFELRTNGNPWRRVPTFLESRQFEPAETAAMYPVPPVTVGQVIAWLREQEGIAVVFPVPGAAREIERQLAWLPVERANAARWPTRRDP
jgi:hypothetical protein